MVVFEAGNLDEVATGVSPARKDVERQKLCRAPALLPRFFALTHGGDQGLDEFPRLLFLSYPFPFPIVHRLRRSPELGRNSSRSCSYLEGVCLTPLIQAGGA